MKFNDFGCGNNKCEKRFECNKYINVDDEKYQTIANLNDICEDNNYEYFEELQYKNVTDKKTIELIKESVDYLLEADLREENGWTQSNIEILEKVRDGHFSIKFYE